MNASAELLKELRIDRSAPPPTRPPRRWPWLVLAALVLLAAAGWWLFGRGRALEVKTAPVVAIAAGGQGASVLDASGYVVARRMATVATQVIGVITEVLFEEGDRVEQGQVLARLDQAASSASLTAARQQAAQARALAGQYTVQLAQAERESARQQQLAERQLVSRQDAEQAIENRDSLRAQLQAQQRSADYYQAEVASAQVNHDYTVIRAPFTGVITSKAAQVGETISPYSSSGFTRTGIGTIVDMDSLEVEVEVGEAYIGRVQAGMPVEAVLNAYPDWHIPGAVIAIIPAADRGKATVKVRVAMNAKDPRIVPDMGVRVSFLEKPRAAGEDRPQGVRVPAGALTQRDGTTVAFVVGDGDRVAMRAVKTGIDMDKDKQVLSGLSAGDTVVLDPPPALQDGAKVKLAEGE
ncbi:MAG: efflux RND transporter periplasmic adaptor subunit [Pseudoxanthomonas sp.]